MKGLVALIRREFWEHRMLVLVPGVLCVLYLALCIFAGTRITVNWPFRDGVEVVSGPISTGFYLQMNVVFTILLHSLMVIVIFFYLCDCLYSERKDRSILFWKSMPVSDARTVLSKLFVALIAVPLIVFALALATNLLTYVVFKVTYGIRPSLDPDRQWTMFTWARVNAIFLMDVFVLALWFAPVAAYQLLVSVFVRRAVFVWTVLPPVVLILGQKIFFDSWSIADLLKERMGGIGGSLNAGGRVTGGSAIDAINLLPMLARPDLWAGVAIAVALIFFTIRIRRHSDDS